MRLGLMIVFYLLYWGVCYLGAGTDKKNLIGLRSYPQPVQDAVRQRMPQEAPKEKSMAAILGSNLGQYRTIRWQRRRCLFRHLLLADFSIYLQ